MIKEQHFSIKAHAYNEDRFVVTDGLFAVIDGASGLTPKEKDGIGTKASRLATFVKAALQRYHGKDVEQFLRELSRRAYAEGFDNHVSCAISVLHLSKDTARFYTVGDCEIIYRRRDGVVSRFRQTELSVLDNKAIEEMVRYAAKNNISVREARGHIQDMLIGHRALMNTPQGYSVFVPSPTADFEIKSKVLARSELESLYLCTDGFLPCFTELDIFKDVGELFTTSLSVKDICLQIQKILRQDKDFNRFPRFKLFDDITAIRLNFGT